jgi:hypothetical protein
MAKRKIVEGGASLLDMLGNGLRIGDEAPLPNQPSSANILGQNVQLGGSSSIRDSARQYAEQNGIPYYEVLEYAKVNPEFASKIAREYDLMAHDPSNPNVQAAYKTLADETMAQYEKMLSDGIKPYFIKGDDPYAASPYLSLLDLTNNKRLGVFPTRSGFGSDASFDPKGNPLMEETGLTLDGEPLLFNDAFRAVHDYYGHGKQGVGFRASGEENAFRAHSGMFSDDAARAIASETRGQNSWLNYGPFGDTNRTATIDETVFADQKTGLLPNWAAMQNTPRAEARRNDFFERIRSGDAGNMRGLTGAITPEGNLRLIHYTGKPIDRIDPSSYGSGLSGRTRAERNRSYDEDFQNRSFYGVEDSDNPYRPERGLNTSNKLETEIPIEQVYDIANDPDNLRSKLPKNLSEQEETTQLEKLINQSGYSGYIVRSKDKGDVAAIFDPLDAKRVTKVRLSPETVITSGLIGGGGYSALRSDNALADPVSDLRTAETQWDMTPEERAIADLRASEDGFMPTSDPQWKPARLPWLADTLGQLKGNKNYQNAEMVNPLASTVDALYNTAMGADNTLGDYIFTAAETVPVAAGASKGAMTLWDLLRGMK